MPSTATNSEKKKKKEKNFVTFLGGPTRPVIRSWQTDSNRMARIKFLSPTSGFIVWGLLQLKVHYISPTCAKHTICFKNIINQSCSAEVSCWRCKSKDHWPTLPTILVNLNDFHSADSSTGHGFLVKWAALTHSYSSCPQGNVSL